MKKAKNTLFIILLLCPCLAFGADIMLRDGTIYRRAQVTSVEGDGVRISHADGVAKVLFKDLPSDLQKKYHYGPSKVPASPGGIAGAQGVPAGNEVAGDGKKPGGDQNKADESRSHAQDVLQAQQAISNANWAIFYQEIIANETNLNYYTKSVLGFQWPTLKDSTTLRKLDFLRRYYYMGRPEIIVVYLSMFGLIAFGMIFYLIPTLIAHVCRKKAVWNIFILNLCLGWCIVGWAALLVWAFASRNLEES